MSKFLNRMCHVAKFRLFQVMLGCISTTLTAFEGMNNRYLLEGGKLFVQNMFVLS